jgi:hypothetical protein
MKKLLQKIISVIKKESLSQEAILAYYNRLPEKITVNWKKRGNFIVGTVEDNKDKYYTQGKNVDDFFEMVNDAVYTFHEIPEEYKEEIMKSKAYYPNQEQLKKLEKISGKAKKLYIKKDKQVLANA